MTHKLPELGYAYDALEPFIDAKTMEIHHSKHHQGYVNNLNAALEGTELQGKSVEELLKDLNSVPENIRTAVRNNGGGHYNHSLFWPTLKKDVELAGEVSDLINNKFGSFDSFKEQFSKTALGIFGSGWTWLVLDNGELKITTTPNQDNPLSHGKDPILGLDMWEHAFYILRNNRKNEYVEAWWNVVNWDHVNENLKKAKG